MSSKIFNIFLKISNNIKNTIFKGIFIYDKRRKTPTGQKNHKTYK